MPEQQPKFTCEICGGAHPTSEHKKGGLGDYAEDNPDAVAKGEGLFQRCQEFEKAGKLQEALQTLKEDKFAMAAYLADRRQKDHKGLIRVPISDYEAAKQDRKDRLRAGTESFSGASRVTGMDLFEQLEKRLREDQERKTLEEREGLFERNKGNVEAAVRFYLQRRAGEMKPFGEFGTYIPGRSSWHPAESEYRPCCDIEVGKFGGMWRHCLTMRHVANLFGVNEYALRRAIESSRVKKSEK